MTESGEFGKKTEKKEVDSTPQESEAMSRYIDLRKDAYKALMSAEERKDFAQNLIDLVNILNKGDGISPDFREDLLKQIQTIEENYVHIKKAVEAVKQLERESHGGNLVPHLYEKAVGLIHTAIDNGVPADSLRPLQGTIQEYLDRVRSRSKQR